MTVAYPETCSIHSSGVYELRTEVTFLRNQIPYSLIISDKWDNYDTNLEIQFQKHVYRSIAFLEIPEGVKPCEDLNAPVTEVNEKFMKQVISEEMQSSFSMRPIKSLYEPDNRKIMNTETVGTRKQLVSFGNAIEALKQGKRVQREGWNGKGMFLLLISPYHTDQFDLIEKETTVGTFSDYIAMKTADNKNVPWLASQTDVLAEDWIILD